MVFGLFKKKSKDKPAVKGPAKYFNLTVKEVIRVTQDAVNIVFENPGSDFQYEPGQFLTIILTINEEKVRRAYSLCTTPGVDEFPAVTVKRVEGGLVSNYLNDNIKAGDELEIMEPMGMFTTPFDRNNERHVVLLGGGSGITPLFSILKATLSREPKTRISLIYANRNKDSIIFKDELDQILNENNDHLSVIHSLDSGHNGWDGHTGLLSIDKLKGILESLPDHGVENTEYFTCGPEILMDIVFDTLNELNIPDNKRNRESFVAGTTSPDEIIAPEDAVDRKVSIVLNGTEHEVNVPAGKAILESALESGMDMPYSCQSGLCTACRAKCLSGKVSLDDADGLSQDEIANDYVLTCVGKPLSDDVKVEMG